MGYPQGTPGDTLAGSFCLPHSGVSVAYKRSQIEDAISQSNVVRGPARSKLLVRMKRLLDLDRKTPLKRGNKRKQQYAFFSEDKPGAGNEIWFQEYEVFAIELALTLAAQGVPQIDVVQILRTLRPDLEKKHRELLEKPLIYYADIKKAVREGEPVVSEHPAFLSVTQASNRSNFVTKNGLTAGVVHDYMKIWDHGQAATTVEFSLFPHAIRSQLAKTEPRKKGRPS